jgi:hypothetical protein
VCFHQNGRLLHFCASEMSSTYYYILYWLPRALLFICNPIFSQATCSVCCLLHASFLHDLLFSPEHGSDLFLRNVVGFHRTTRSYNPGYRTPQIIIQVFFIGYACASHRQITIWQRGPLKEKDSVSLG